jgi:uncharacterized protein (DUF934 family)
MPLVREGRFVADPFVRIGGDWELPVDTRDLGRVIVPFDWLADLTLPLPPRIGTDVANDATWESLSPFVDGLALIAIAFPVFSDGRGFSLAKLLRNRGYGGTLRALGPLIADQYRQAIACGFDEIEIPEALAQRQPESLWKAAAGQAGPFLYQQGYQQPSILTQRRRARTGDHHG